jgi:hypothetical protein
MVLQLEGAGTIRHQGSLSPCVRKITQSGAIAEIFMSHLQIVVSVCDGQVQDVFCSEEGADLIIVDWDVAEITPNAPRLVEVLDDLGHDVPIQVVGARAATFHEIRGTMVEAALTAAEHMPEIV